MNAGRNNGSWRPWSIPGTQLSTVILALLLPLAVGCVAPGDLSDDEEEEEEEEEENEPGVERDAGTSFGQDVNGPEVSSEGAEPAPWQGEEPAGEPGREPEPTPDEWSPREGNPPPTVAPATCSQTDTHTSTLWWRRR